MNFSFQLYSARNFTPWTVVIPRLAELGYTQVEGFGGVYDDVSALRGLLAEDLWRQGTDAANWIALAKRLNEVGKRVHDAGFRFSWHNHDWEFKSLTSGELPMDILLENAPEMGWEMDVAWLIRGGVDPTPWIKAHAGRLTSAHVKDIAEEGEKLDEDGWADVGDGVVDWTSHMANLRNAGVDLFVAEHDNPTDWDRFASRSIKAFSQY